MDCFAGWEKGKPGEARGEGGLAGGQHEPRGRGGARARQGRGGRGGEGRAGGGPASNQTKIQFF